MPARSTRGRSHTSAYWETSRNVRRCHRSLSAALATIDTVYVAKRHISSGYLLEAVTEIALVAGWARLCGQRSRRPRIE